MFESILYPGITVASILVILWLIHKRSTKSKRESESRKERRPTVYETMPHYFPTEQVDIVRKIKPKKRRDEE